MQRYQVMAPNTFEFAKYGDMPVDYASGVPGINIPLAKLVDDDISVDISLSYHASGIKVDQEATWVGLGWALNCGGVITRQVQGTADGFDMTGNFKRRTAIPDYNPGTQTIDQYMNLVRSDLNYAATNGTDNGADMFYYNFGGRSGKFFLDNNRNAVFTKYEDLKVSFEMINGSYDNTKFIITDENGVKYEFRDKEYGSSAGESFTTGWYLSEITSPSGATITFEYLSGSITTLLYQKRCFTQVSFGTWGSTGNHTLPQIYTTACIDGEGPAYGLVPKKITTSAGNSVELITATTPRLDAEAGNGFNQLKSLVLRDDAQTEIRRFNFNYSYFEANNNRKFPVTGVNDGRAFLNYRMRLDSLDEVSPAGSSIPPYKFAYLGDNNPQTDDVLTLPYRLSPSQDHLGYYNGSNNLTIFPSNAANNPWTIDELYRQSLWGGVLVGPFTSGFTYLISNGGNREVDAEAVKAGMLSKITYPTGGYTTFEFEIHEGSSENYLYPVAGGVRVKQITSNAGTGTSVIKNYEYLGHVSTVRCLSINPYYSFYRNPDVTDSHNGDRLVMFGVSPAVAYSNEIIVKGDAASQMVLGIGASGNYTQVKESQPGNGYTIYSYNYAIDGETGTGSTAYSHTLFPGIHISAYAQTYPMGGLNTNYLSFGLSSCTFPYPNYFNNDWQRGVLTSKATHKEDGTLLQSDSIFYQMEAIKSQVGFKVSASPNGVEYIYARYYDVGGLVKPVREVSTIYGEDNTYFQQEKQSFYNSTAHKLVTETKMKDSKGDITTTQYYYPTEYTTAFSTLKSKHFLRPVDTRVYKNGTLVSGYQVSYTDAGLPATMYQAESAASPAFTPATPFTFVPKLDMQYNLPDNSLLSQTDNTGKKEIFLWSYKAQYPVAKIENMTYAELVAAVPGIGGTLLQIRNASVPSVANLNFINSLRQNAALSKAFITTYTFKPLVGMLSQTDPNGRTTYYEYDSFSRLLRIRDHDNNILKQYDYKFQASAQN